MVEVARLLATNLTTETRRAADVELLRNGACGPSRIGVRWLFCEPEMIAELSEDPELSKTPA